MSELNDIRRENYEALNGRDVVLLIKSDYGWKVGNWLSSGGIAPTTDYDTPQEAGARALQLMGLTEPVTPQNWPEIAQIGGDGRSPLPRPDR